jgi:hypothetical protein
MTTSEKLAERKRLEQEFKSNRAEYEKGSITYNEYDKIARQISREFVKYIDK